MGAGRAAINRMAAKDELNAALMIKTVSSNAIQNPLVGIVNKAKADMVRYAAEFGNGGDFEGKPFELLPGRSLSSAPCSAGGG